MGISPGDGNEIQNCARAVVAGILLTVIAYGCAGGEQRTVPVSRSIIADVVVSVDNRTERPVKISAGTRSFTETLGVVPGRAIKLFSIPSSLGNSVTPLMLDARLSGGTLSARSPSFRLSNGHTIVWTIDNSSTGIVTMR